MWLITLNGGDVQSFLSLHQLLTLSLWRCRSRRACVRACVHPHARVCGRVCACTCICACARVRVHAHAYACACMCPRMRRWGVLVAAPRCVRRCLGRAYAPMCMCMHVHAYMHGRVCARPALSVTCTLNRCFGHLCMGGCVRYTGVFLHQRTHL